MGISLKDYQSHVAGVVQATSIPPIPREQFGQGPKVEREDSPFIKVTRK